MRLEDSTVVGSRMRAKCGSGHQRGMRCFLLTGTTELENLFTSLLKQETQHSHPQVHWECVGASLLSSVGGKLMSFPSKAFLFPYRGETGLYRPEKRSRCQDIDS
jgi:hypothetical protein